MYGSIHTHLESEKDAINASYNSKGKISFEEALNEFYKLGAKRIAVTEHGSFASFEDIWDSLQSFKKQMGSEADDFEVIPGEEIYFDYKGTNDPNDRAHLILIAKDRTGYEQLCKIHTESANNVQVSTAKNYHVVTLDNLIKNIGDDKGHLICSSACIAGPFAKALIADNIFVDQDIEKRRKKLEENGYFEHKAIIDAFEAEKARLTSMKPTSAQKKEAKAKKDIDLQKSIIDREIYVKDALKSEEYLKMKEDAEEASKFIKSNRLTKGANLYYKALERQEAVHKETEEHGLEIAKELFATFKDLFGDDFYFELQNHHLPIEKTIYNRLIQFAIDEGHPNFIASNDIHIAKRKSDPNFEKAVTKREVAKFLLFGKVDNRDVDTLEYGIKDDNELREELLNVVEDYKGFTKEQIVDSAIGNIENSLSECKGYERIKNKSYPVFAPNDKELLLELIKAGVKEKFPNGFPKGKEQIYIDRLKKEYKIICEMGYASYHLIVQDYIKYGRLLGYLKSDEEIENAPLTIEELDAYITEKGYERIGYSMGPGRGSGAGSLVCYSTGIVDVDPIKYDLLFERFLNPERKSMPDIDVDFAPNIRDKCVRYVENKYGEDKVCKIITKSYSKSKGAIRLAARYLGSLEARDKDLDPSKDSEGKPIVRHWSNLADAICKYIDSKRGDDSMFDGMEDIYIDPELQEEEGATNDNELDFLTTEAISEILNSSTLKAMQEKNNPQSELMKILSLSKVLNGMYTASGQHAAGVIISSVPLNEVMPIMYNPKKGTMQTQAVMAQCEAMGLLKMDFLGLRNLSIISNVMKITGDKNLMDYTKRDEILNDPRIYKNIFRALKTAGIFQFESAGMQNTLDLIKPTCFEDIIAAISLFRPGPMDYIPEFARNKNNPQYIKYICPEMEEITGNTYGVIVYQEQVMHIFQKLAGYTLGGADAVRKAISKKHIDEIEAERGPFIHGDPERNIEGIVAKCGVTEEAANKLFDTMVKFGEYAFNKSHATAYAMVALFTAYLKEYHPIEFYIECLKSYDTNKRSKIMSRYIKEMQQDGISMIPPSIYYSQAHFAPYKGNIIMGFCDIKDMQAFNIEYRTDNLNEFILKNPKITAPTLNSLASLGLFKTTWSKESKHCSITEAKDFIEKVKPLADKINYCNNEGVSLKNAYISETDATEKEKIKNLYVQNQNTFKNVIVEYNALKEQWDYPDVSSEDRIELFKNEKEYLGAVLSVQREIGLLKNSFTDFSDERFFDPTSKPILVDAIIVDLSDAKKTKTGNTYYQATLMDKNKNTIVRRFPTPPPFMIGMFSLQPNETKYFMSRAIQPLSNTKSDRKIENKSFESTLAGIAKGEIKKEDIVGSDQVDNEHTVSFSVTKTFSPLFNSKDNTKNKEQEDICMEERN